MYADRERQREAERRWYQANKAKVAAKKDRKRERLRKLVRAAKDRPCADCGVSYPYYVMDLDHLGEDKTMIVSKLVNFGATGRVLEEIAKCEAVCSNCHRARTWRRQHGDAIAACEPPQDDDHIAAFRERGPGTLADCPPMGDQQPDLHMLNVVVSDMGATVEFYRRLGVNVPENAGATGPHVQLRMPSGFSLELDTDESARLWHAGFRDDPQSVDVVIGFALDSREAVDRRYEELAAAGYETRQPPFDAFWGARYAIVADPDGNDVGLMSPIDEARRTQPSGESPAP